MNIIKSLIMNGSLKRVYETTKRAETKRPKNYKEINNCLNCTKESCKGYCENVKGVRL